MNKNLRRVHLDFHTSEYIDNIGEKFNKNQFKEALRIGKVTSITLFGKCHHGYTYYPSKIGVMHPHLKFNLLKEQIDAAHEINVKTPIYLPIGWSAYDADNYPEWLARDFETKEISYYRYDPNAKPEDEKPMCSWKVLCPVGEYKKYLMDLTREICENFNPVDGLFFDICFLGDACGCPDCIKGMKKKGYNPLSLDDAKKYYIEERIQLLKDLKSLVKSYNKEATVFFNGGAEILYPMYHEYQTHYELEDLPTAWGGYDRLPVRSKFFTGEYNKQVIGMTGKFHTTWGEFGGFKLPEALKYECANMLALGAGCSIGDQLHPSGLMDLETYKLIGYAYDYIEKIENYCVDMKEYSNLGFVLSKNISENEGLSKILMEKHHGYSIITENTDIDKLKCIIVTNNAIMSDKLKSKIVVFTKSGGKLFLIGNAVNQFSNLGFEDLGKSQYQSDYIIDEDMNLLSISSPILCYSSANMVKADSSYKVLARVYEPYFDRTYGKYCSHRNTPYKKEYASYPASVTNGNVTYIAHDIPEIYYNYGSAYHRDYFIKALKTVLIHNTCEIEGLMSCGRMRITENDDYYALHLLYASPVNRGEACVIEDTVEIYNVRVKVFTDFKISEVVKIPQNEQVDFTERDGGIEFTIDKFKNHQLIVIKKAK